MNKYLIAIVGPTAIGKTALAIELAKHFNTEIISADSRQFFREMSIGTAKPDGYELAQAKHHFIDSHSITQAFSVGSFEVEALQLLEQLFKEHQVTIMVGGSGLYIDAVCKGLDNLPQVEPHIRETLNQLFQQEGITALQERLQALDPEYYQQVDTANPQRMIRALEVCIATKQPFSSFLVNAQKARPFNIIKIGLDTDRETLYARINQRVDSMIQAGLVEEVKGLMDYRQNNALITVGYREIFDHLDGQISLERAIELIKQNTRRFAKRQLTWFRRDEHTKWFEPEAFDEIIRYLSTVIPAQNK